MVESGEPVADRFGYQPALDGLRALAVAGVLVFHHTFTNGDSTGWASGGFLGVDVFFVLSGFLITSLLLVERRRERRIDYRAFWARRARRLFPALVVMLLGVAAFGAFVASPSARGELRGDAFATLLYGQNWHTIATGPERASALAHAWSLSVEEQWYLVWPIVVGGLLVVFRGRFRRLLPVTVALALVSAAGAGVFFASDQVRRAYYGTDTRAQSLLVGAALAVLLLGWGPVKSRVGRAALEAAGIAGLGFLAVVVPIAYPYAAWLYRGGFLAVAIAAALAIAAAVHPEGRVLRRGLAWRPLVGLGLISYGVYLYHLPVFVWLSPARTGLDDVPLFALRVGVTLVIAVLSYRLVEQPVRRGALGGRRAWIALPAGFAATALLLTAATIGATGPSPREQVVDALRRASRRAPAGATKVLVIGGTGASLLALQSKGPYDGNGIRGAAVGRYGCGLTPGTPMLAGRAVPTPAGCDQRLAEDRAAVDAFRPAVVVVMADASEMLERTVDGRVLRAGSPELVAFLERELERLRREVTADGAVMVLLTVPCGGVSDPGLLWLNRAWRSFAREHRVAVGELGAFRCPDGRPRADRLGADATWRWLAPVATAARRERPTSAG